jgi:hypothetical protein
MQKNKSGLLAGFLPKKKVDVFGVYGWLFDECGILIYYHNE